MTKTRAILLLLILGVAAFLFVRFYPGRRIPRHFDGPSIVSATPLRSRAVSIRFSPDSKYLLVAGSVGSGSIGRYENGESLRYFDDKMKRLRLFDVAKRKEVERLKPEPLFGGWNGDHMLITPDFKTLITTSHFENLKIIDVRKRMPDQSIEILSSGGRYRVTVTSIEISPDGETLALGTIGGAHFYDLKTYRLKQTYDHYGGNFGAVISFGRRSDVVMLVYPGSKTPHFASVKTGKRIPTPRSTREFEVTHSPNVKYFANISDKDEVAIWQTGAEQSFRVGTFRTRLIETTTVAFSPDNKILAIGGLSSTENPVHFYKLSDITAQKQRAKSTVESVR